MMNQSTYIAQAAPSTGITAPATPAKAPAPEQPGGAFFLWPILLIAVFYFILIRPQAKREKDRQKAIKALAKNDKVVTRGGIWGVVVGLKDNPDVAVVKIADNVKIEVSKSAIETVNPQENASGDDKKSEKK